MFYISIFGPGSLPGGAESTSNMHDLKPKTI